MRSPLYAERKPLPFGGEALYTYERSLWPVPLEGCPPAPPGWEGEALLCRSLEAAHATLFVSLCDLLEEPLQVRCWKAPASLGPLLDCLAPGRWSSAFRLTTLHSSMASRRANVFVVDAQDWERGEVRPTGVLVLDLSRRPDFPLLDLLDDCDCWLVATLQRWRAPELSSPALLSLYARPSKGEGLSTLGAASELARRVRSVVGASPSFTQLWEWSLADRELSGYRERVPAPKRPARGWPHQPAFAESERAWLGELKKWRRSTLALADRSRPLELSALEQRLQAYEEIPVEPLLFSSAMAALAALAVLMPRLSSQAAYFETAFLLKVLRASGQDVQWLESVRYDWELTPWDLELAFPSPVLVVDTTLTGNRFRLSHLWERHRPQLAVRVFSALKLDQRGQELENVGAVLLSGSPEVVAPVAQALRALRSACGTEPECARLSPDWVLDPTDPHAEAVLESNAWLAARLRPGGLLRRVVHPGLTSSLPWACAPFVVLHLAPDSHPWITAAVEREARALPFGRGASFGFVDHRHESIIPVLREQRPLFKVAMGSSPGPSRQAVLEILQRVLSHSSVGELRRAYPGLRPARTARDWSAPSPRMLRFLGTQQSTLD